MARETRVRNIILTDFEPVRIGSSISQKLTTEILAYCCAKAYCLSKNIVNQDFIDLIFSDMRSRIKRYALSPQQIASRNWYIFPEEEWFLAPDGSYDMQKMDVFFERFFGIEFGVNGLDSSMRHQLYTSTIAELTRRFYPTDAIAPRHLIHVTCSGYLAPNSFERLVSEKKWTTTTVTNCYHMGCYGAFPAIRMAHGFLSSSLLTDYKENQKVDIIHTELLSLHHKVHELSESDIVVMTLFSDGLIKYSARIEGHCETEKKPHLRILALQEYVIPDSCDDMMWTPGAYNFDMTLSVMVPRLIKNNVVDFTSNLLAMTGIDFSSEKNNLQFAIHPGGPKIVEHIQQALGLSNCQVASSQRVFLANGNMSSATIPHILNDILEDDSIKNDSIIVSFAFGPGLTVTGAVFQKVHLH